MRFHPTGLVVLAVILLWALFAGAVPAVGILRVALVVYAAAAFLEVVVNMVRYQDTHVRSRLLGRLFQSTFSAGFAHWRSPENDTAKSH